MERYRAQREDENRAVKRGKREDEGDKLIKKTDMYRWNHACICTYMLRGYQLDHLGSALQSKLGPPSII